MNLNKLKKNSAEFVEAFKDVEALKYFTDTILIPYAKSGDADCFEGSIENFASGYVMFIRCGYVSAGYSKQDNQYVLSIQNIRTRQGIVLDSTQPYSASFMHSSILDIID